MPTPTNQPFPSRPLVAVVGAGAIGSFYGGLLSRGGLDVTFIDPWRDHVDRINDMGLSLTINGAETTVRPRAVIDAGAAEPADIVIVQCKSLHTREAVMAARPLFHEGTVATTFQNGLGNEEVIGEIVGIDKVLGGLTINGANIVGPGAVMSYSLMPSYVGELKGGVSDRASWVAGVFSEAGFPVHVSSDILREKWMKFFANVALSAASTITDLNTREMMSSPEMLALILATIEEARAVAHAAGQFFSEEESRRVLMQIAEGGTAAENRSSAAIDLGRRRRTEVDFISGAVVRLGRAHGVPTPINQALQALVKGLELKFD